jgi:hypothetical protein
VSSTNHHPRQDVSLVVQRVRHEMGYINIVCSAIYSRGQAKELFRASCLLLSRFHAYLSSILKASMGRRNTRSGLNCSCCWKVRQWRLPNIFTFPRRKGVFERRYILLLYHYHHNSARALHALVTLLFNHYLFYSLRGSSQAFLISHTRKAYIIPNFRDAWRYCRPC